MKFAGTILETYPGGVTLAVEVRVEAPDGDSARPVADAAMAALEARPLAQAVTRRVVPVALVKDLQELADSIIASPILPGRVPQMLPLKLGVTYRLHTDAKGHLAVDEAIGVADDDGMRRDSRE